MLKLLRSDFYRLFKSLSFYICIVVESALFCLGIIVIERASHMSGEAGQMYKNMLPASGMAYGVTVFNNNLTMIISIVIAIFVTAEFAHGTMKNVVSKGFSKIQIYFSKLVTMLAASYIMIFASMLVGTVCAAIMIGKFGSLNADMLKTVGMELLLFTALTAIFVFISMLVRNLGGVIAINIVGVLSFGPLIFSLLEFLIKSKIDFTKFSLINNISLFNSGTAANSDYLRAVIVALVYFAVTAVLGILAFEKSDIK